MLTIGALMHLDVEDRATGAHDTLFSALITDVLILLTSGATYNLSWVPRTSALKY